MKFRFGTHQLVVWVAFLAILVMATRVSADTDTWWHLRAGQWIVAHRSVPQVDPFSYTRLGAAWQYPGWLVEVPMFAMFQAAGPGGLNLWTAVMIALAFGFVWKTLIGGPFLRAFALIIGATVSSIYWAARPYLVTFLFSAVYLWILEDFHWRRSAQTERRLWLLPALMVLWANSHGGFASGFLLWGVYLAGAFTRMNLRALERAEVWLFIKGLRPLLLAGIFMLVAVCLNPSGPVMLLYPFKTVGIGALQKFIQEWQSPNFHSPQAQPFAWALFLILGLVGASRRRIALTDFLLVAGFGYLSLIAARNIALFALVAPMVLTRHADPIVAALSRRFGWRWVRRPASTAQTILNTVLVSLLALAWLGRLVLVITPADNEKEFRKTLPVDAVTFLKTSSLPGRLFNSYNWGAYLLWNLPEYPVFVDGRTDLYNDEILNEWLKVVQAEPGWQQSLDAYAVNLVLIETGIPLENALEQDDRWERAYQDDISVVYARKIP